MLEINALFEPDTEKGGFVVTFPDFPWGVTQGETEEEATEMAVDAIGCGHVVREFCKEPRLLHSSFHLSSGFFPESRENGRQ